MTDPKTIQFLRQYMVPIGLCMLHVSDHATYHRGQINSMIKRAGGTPSGVMVDTYGVQEGIGRGAIACIAKPGGRGSCRAEACSENAARQEPRPPS